VADAAPGQQLARAAAVGVAPGAIGHDPAGADAAGGEPREGAVGERGDGGGLLVASAAEGLSSRF
jgi:hypothetical protein